jgi:hypothetical protein
MEQPVERIVITDLRIPFWRLVVFLIKLAFAAIPATVVVTLIIMLVSAALVAVLGDSEFLTLQRWKF